MYLAKDRGRARYEEFDDDLRRRIERRLDTELALRAAVQGGEIETWSRAQCSTPSAPQPASFKSFGYSA